MENNKKILMGVLAAAVASILSVAIFSYAQLPFNTATASNTTEKSELQKKIDEIKLKTPKATISEGKTDEVLKDHTDLKKVKESREASNTEDPSLDRKPIAETPIVVSGFYQKGDASETVALEVENTGQKPIYIITLALTGYIQVEDGVQVETVYRPIISDPYDIVGATTTEPQKITPDNAITAYIEDVLEADEYSAVACYTYEKPHAWDYGLDEPDLKVQHIPSYCTSFTINTE